MIIKKFTELLMNNSFWKKVFYGGCALFCVLAVLISLLMLIINSATTENTFDIALSVFRILMLAVFCFAFSFACTFYRVDSMKEWLRLCLHFIITALAFFVCIYSPVNAEINASGGEMPSENSLIVFALFTVVYFVCYGILKAAKSLSKKSKAKKEEYSPVYKKSKK